MLGEAVASLECTCVNTAASLVGKGFFVWLVLFCFTAFVLFVGKCYNFLWDKENKLDNVYFRTLFLASQGQYRNVEYSDMLGIYPA